ncbi:MAG: hypothetical protein J6C05_08910 [Prevotella sp.]|nr:hypothetical protein [Prevotella sp.]MBO5157228.1 hypothetical protein [Prevotella sp.]
MSCIPLRQSRCAPRSWANVTAAGITSALGWAGREGRKKEERQQLVDYR